MHHWDIVQEFKQRVEEETGHKCPAAKILNALVELLEEHQDRIDLDNLEYMEDLKHRIRAGFCEGQKKK